MKYSVGYQLRENSDFLQSIVRNKEHIYEVYFSWGDFANGRNSQLRQSDLTPWEAQLKQETVYFIVCRNTFWPLFVIAVNAYNS